MVFEELYHLHKNLVFNLALHYVQNTEDAQEITQDVFVSVFHSLQSFKQEAKIETWLYRITINKSLDHLRKRKRKKRFAFIVSLPEDSTSFSEHPDFNHPGVQLEQKQAMSQIFRCINELPERQKTALILSKIEQLSQNEIAAIMRLSPKAVESLVQRAKNSLLKKLDSEGK